MKLGSIATVRSGLVLSRKQAKDPSVSSNIRYPLLNLRSFNPKGYIDITELDVFDAYEPLSSEYLSHIGDVIVRLSAPYTAVLIDCNTEGMVISSNFVIIRTDSQELLPEYLFWLLNTQKVKRAIFENTGSNMLGAIKARYFSEFDIYPIPYARQKQIATVYELSLKEASLLRQLADEKERYYSLMIDHAQKEYRKR